VLFYLALRRFQMSFHTIVLTLSPVITVIWSFFLFDLKPSFQSFIGGAAVMAGVALVTLNRSRAGRSEVIERPPA
jgi:drug/metabolite transporter (DMT)-like permease